MFSFIFLGSENSDEGLEEVLTTVKKAAKPPRKRQNSQSGAAPADFGSVGANSAPVTSNSFGRRISKPNFGDYDKPNGMKPAQSNAMDERYNEMDLLRKSDKVKPRKRNDSKSDRTSSLKIDRADDNLNLFSAALDYGRDNKVNGGTRSERRQQRGDGRAVETKHDQQDGFDFFSHLDFKYGSMSSIQGDLDRMQDLMFPEISGSSTKNKSGDSKLVRGKPVNRNRKISKKEEAPAAKTNTPHVTMTVPAESEVNNHKVSDFTF